MLTLEQIAPQLAALVAVLAVVSVLSYLGVKHTMLFLVSLLRGTGRKTWSRKRAFLSMVWGANVTLLALFAYGWLWEADWVERVDATVEANVPAPIRIVHLSDLHLEGFGLREKRALSMVEDANPDLVLLTGDYLSKQTEERYTADLHRFLLSLPPSAEAFATPGNWDTDSKAFDGTRVQYLASTVADVRVGEALIKVYGSWFDTAPLESADDGADLTIYLQHSPDFLKEVAAGGYDLYLAGHTHGGQVRIPGFGAVITLSRHWKRYEAGLFREGDTYLYVNRGLGMEGGAAPRIRLFCRPEVTVITVRPRASRPLTESSGS